ncbi:MAG: 3-isopropylmalate dehydrogenase [Coriobacteriaceae bacterium]|nr:3-isopropylmalate dehydrogenase [Coriobacteriaceae bacterium]
MAQFKVAVLPGDGIGPDITAEAVKVLGAVAARFGHGFVYTEALIGGAAIDAAGSPLPDETLSVCEASDAVLLGAIGGPKWDTTDPNGIRPEQGLLGIRKALGLYANLRPVRIFDALIDSSTVKPEVIRGVDIMIVRELTGGIYFGERGRVGDMAYDTETYHAFEVERIVRKACELARARGTSNVCSVDKANVLESSRLWREVAHKAVADYPDIELWDLLVDNCAMQLVKNPRQFDVVVMSNMFGDILSDEASMLSGSLGMLASASLGDGPGLYEPSHGSAPKYTGMDVANPTATVLSAALMLRYSFGLEEEAASIETAIERVLADGFRTKDIFEEGRELVGTSRMGDLVAERV